MTTNDEQAAAALSAPLSWRDVYRAVGESETRVLGAINNLDERYETLFKIESRRIDAAMAAEIRRIDANRATDLQAIILSNARAEILASALAERVDTTAKTAALAVETTAKAAALSVEATTISLVARIKPLEDTRYEQAGRKQGITDVGKVIYAGLGIGVSVVIYILSQAKI